MYRKPQTHFAVNTVQRALPKFQWTRIFFSGKECFEL